MTAYQRRKREIFYLEQCIRELEDVCLRLAAQIPGPIMLPLGGGMGGDDVLTLYNSDDGTFFLRLIDAQRQGLSGGDKKTSENVTHGRV